jgi:hypothetical protein
VHTVVFTIKIESSSYQKMLTELEIFMMMMMVVMKMIFMMMMMMMMMMMIQYL